MFTTVKDAAIVMARLARKSELSRADRAYLKMFGRKFIDAAGIDEIEEKTLVMLSAELPV